MLMARSAQQSGFTLCRCTLGFTEERNRYVNTFDCNNCARVNDSAKHCCEGTVTQCVMQLVNCALSRIYNSAANIVIYWAL